MTKARTPPAWRRPFLRELARSGSVRLAAEACGLDPTYPYQLRSRNAAFAASWERALATARERLAAQQSHPYPLSLRDTCGSPQAGGEPGSASVLPSRLREGSGVGSNKRPLLQFNETIRASKNGKCCIMRTGPGRWSAGKEAVFLAELTASANVKAAARAAGVSTVVVYNRRKQWPAFKAQWDAAIAEGHARIETLLVCAATTILDPEPLPDRAWEGPEMSVDQALKLHLAHRASQQGARRGGLPRREPDIEEVRAEMLRKVAAIKRAREKSADDGAS